ncbi:MAG: 4Fe-4S dicluster domain-containing protein [bacterium]
MADNAFLYDGSLCIACRSCQVACKQWNYLPGEKTKFFAKAGGYQNPSDLSPNTWTIIKFYEIMKGDKVEWLFRRFHCSHCTDAACIKACPVEPVKAMTRHPRFGTVFVNADLCIGCGACADYCPYGVPHVDPKLEKSRKCTGCFDRVANGLIPACATTCPTRSIKYGTMDEMLAIAAQRTKELKARGFSPVLYGKTQLKGLHSMLLLPEKLENYPDVPPNPVLPKELGVLPEQPVRALPSFSLAAASVGLAVVALERLRQRRNTLSSVEETQEAEVESP